ncbi:RagB/SusD family nutrient uptake outer membrane protein [Bacteroides salyersiae]|nr:RagB/SusD family nutrient uptake outer membrane protein [Bacteroides salyersiae]
MEGLSVREVLTELRARVGQVPIPEDISDSRESMRERIYNERAVEPLL